MAYSKEELEEFIKADRAALRDYDARMLELRRKVREEINELERLEAAQASGTETDGAGETEETP